MTACWALSLTKFQKQSKSATIQDMLSASRARLPFPFDHFFFALFFATGAMMNPDDDVVFAL
jgi:hypothetical protein